MPVIGPATSITGNKYEDKEMPRNTVHEVVEAPLYAVKYTDGYGKTQMRFATLIGGSAFLLPDIVSEKSRAAQKWFSDQMMEKLGQAPKKRVTRRRKVKEDDTKPHKPSKMKPLNVEAL